MSNSFEIVSALRKHMFLGWWGRISAICFLFSQDRSPQLKLHTDYGSTLVWSFVASNDPCFPRVYIDCCGVKEEWNDLACLCFNNIGDAALKLHVFRKLWKFEGHIFTYFCLPSNSANLVCSFNLICSRCSVSFTQFRPHISWECHQNWYMKIIELSFVGSVGWDEF